MVYDEKNQKIVLFGGHSGEVRTDLYFKQPKFRYYPGSLNDTWLYDVKTKEWEQLDLHGPVLTRMPKLFYDPKSGLVLHFTFENYAKPKDSPALCTVETLDVAKKQWYSPQYVPFPAKLQYQSTYSNRTPIFNVAFDPENRLVLLFQNVRDGKEVRQETYAMRLKLKEPKGKGVRWSKPEPVKPQVIPKDDPEWLNKLKTFPANRWTYTDPQPRDARVRDWGNMAVDPVRNLVFYFGGGHSTYQVNDVAIYAPGANKWISAAGDHNDFVPPVGWGGNTMGYRGGPNAHHMRNQYVALDGRMFYGPLWNEQLKCHLVWFYDLDRGGVWRWKKIAKVTIDKGGEKIFSRPHMVDPSGKVLSFQVVPKGRYISGVLGWYFSSYDIYENRLTIKAIPKPWPGRVPECRPFCLLPHRQQIFYYEYNPKRSDDIEHFRFWMYDIKQNKCRQLHPKRKPPKGVAKVVVYLPKQNAILADVRTKNRESENMWVYSLKRNDWTKLPVVGDKSRFVGPYGQMDYLPEYGVVINVNRRTVVMPPDVEKLDWQGE